MRGDIMSQNQKSRWSTILLLGVALAAAVLLILLQRATTFTSDDYYYAIFWQNGLPGFLRRTAGHFFSRNGRVLVHILTSTFAAMDLTVYAVFCTAMLGAIFALLFRYQHDGAPVPRDSWALGCAAFFLCLLTTDYRVMRGWFLCVADAFNYIFPLLMISLLLLCLDAAPRTPAGTAVVLFTALLAGATTEQGGSMAFGLVGLTVLRHWFTDRRLDRRALWALCAVLLGLATIFLSPATRQRAAAEFSLPLLMNSFVQYANSLAAPGLSLRAMVLLCFVMGLLPLTGRAPKPLFAGLPVGALLAAGWLRPLSVEWNTGVCAVFFCYLLASAAALIFRSAYARSGFLLLAGLASAGMVMLSRSCSIRVSTPLLLLMLLCAVYFAVQLYTSLAGEGRTVPAALALTALLAAAMFLQLPVFQGVLGNYAVLRANERAVEEARVTGVLEYQDYNSCYCLQDLFSNEIISSMFLGFYRLPPETQVVSTYIPIDTIPLLGKEEPVILHSGMACIPLEMLVCHNGGSFEVITDNFLRIRTGGWTILYRAPAFYSQDGVVKAEGRVFLYRDYYYIDAALARELGLMG